ncbi:hypothetical protein SAMN05216311_109209 [Chitinophaga sp. CF418]|nr:hypothetical protein SAMN05216311_109209 [Chitinophaga sp. CF418]
MGLDLIHARLSIKDESAPEFFTLDEFDTCPGFIERHQHLMSEIIDMDSIFAICVFAEEEHRQEYENSWGKEENKVIITGNVDDMGEEICEIERIYGLESMHKFIRDGSFFSYKKSSAVRIPCHMIEYGNSYTKEPVLYWTEIGYSAKASSTSEGYTASSISQ